MIDNFYTIRYNYILQIVATQKCSITNFADAVRKCYTCKRAHIFEGPICNLCKFAIKYQNTLTRSTIIVVINKCCVKVINVIWPYLLGCSIPNLIIWNLAALALLGLELNRGHRLDVVALNLHRLVSREHHRLITATINLYGDTLLEGLWNKRDVECTRL